MFNPNLKRSRDLDDVVVETAGGEHEFDSLPPTKKRVKIHKKTTTVIFDVDPCIVTRMNCVFPLTDIVAAFLVATSTSGPIRPTAEKRKRSNNDDAPSAPRSSALPIVTATQLIFPPSSSFLELSTSSSAPSPFTESLSKKRKVDNHDDVSVDFDDDVEEEEDRKPSASERWNLLNNNKSKSNKNNNEVICLDCDDDDDDDGVATVPLPTMKTAHAASMPTTSRAIVSSDDDDDEVQIIGSKGDNALADYAHARADCVVYKFDNSSRHGSDSNKECCKNCFCFVCDIPSSQCQEWTSGSNHHCNAISGDVNSKWSKLRRQHKLKAKAKKATTTKKRRAGTTATATAATVTPPRRKKQTTKTKLTTATKAKKTTTKAAREEQRTEIRLRLKAKFDAAQKNKKKAAAAPKKAPPAPAVATIAAIPAIPAPPQCCSECSKGMQQRDVAVTDQFGHQFCFDCIITSVTNNNNTGTGNNGNAPINLTGGVIDGKKTCSSCGQDGHCLRTSKKCPVYWQLRKESAIKKANRLW